MRVTTAAALLDVSPRQVFRLLARFRAEGAAGLASRRRGRPSNHRLPDAVRDAAVALVRSAYADFGPTLAAEKLAERHQIQLSRETLRGWMMAAGGSGSSARHARRPSTSRAIGGSAPAS